MSGNLQGYDLDRFVSEVDNELVCSVCHGVIRNPMILQCEHIFCKICIETWLEECLKCPICKSEVDPEYTLLPPQRTVVNILSRMKLRCSKECRDVFQLDSIQSHEETCKIVTCPVQNCDSNQVIFAKLKMHLLIHPEVEKDDVIVDFIKERIAHQTSRKRYQAPKNVNPELQKELVNCVQNGDLERTESLICSNMVNINLPVDARFVSGNKFVHEAIIMNNERMAILLLQCGADPDATRWDYTAVSCAATVGLANALEMAMNFSKLSINSDYSGDRHPLYQAVSNGRTECVKILLSHGADPRLCAWRGKSVMEIARELGFNDIVTLLEAAMA